MIKPSGYFTIFKKDLNSGLIKKKERKNLIEYWIYRQKESPLYSLDGKKMKTNEIDKLHCIILCDKDHITEEGQKGYFVNGVRFTDDERGNDLTNYLRKTKRGIGG